METANIFDFLRQLPVGLIAAVAFLVMTLFIALLWLEVAALSHALRKTQAEPSDALQRMCADLDQIEERLAKLDNRLDNLCKDKKQSRNGEG